MSKIGFLIVENPKQMFGENIDSFYAADSLIPVTYVQEVISSRKSFVL